MHSWHIAFKNLFQSFEPYSSKNIVTCPFAQVLGTKGLQKESISKMMLLCYGAILFSLWQISFEKPNRGKIIF
jgi:hypothetical protein